MFWRFKICSLYVGQRSSQPSGMIMRIVGNKTDKILLNAVIIDITEHKEREDNLAFQQESLNMIDRALSAGTIINGLGIDKPLYYVSQNICNLLGYSVEEFSRMIFVSDCHTKELLYANKEAIDNSELKSAEYLSGTCHEFFQGMDKVCPWCFVNSTREGEIADLDLYQENHNKWLHGKAQLVKWGGRDAALHYFTDVTELKNASMEIQRGRQIYETALEAAQLFEFEYDIRRQRITFMTAGQIFSC